MVCLGSTQAENVHKLGTGCATKQMATAAKSHSIRVRPAASVAPMGMYCEAQTAGSLKEAPRPTAGGG